MKSVVKSSFIAIQLAFPNTPFALSIASRPFCKNFRVGIDGGRHAFAKATLEMRQRYTLAAVQWRAKWTKAPMTVARLQCLRQIQDDGMGARHEASLEKEKKMLETMNAATTTAKKPKDQEETLETADAVVQKGKNKANKPSSSAMLDAEARASLDPTVLE